MKKIMIWLNEAEYDRFIRIAKSKGKTPYALLKQIALEYLDMS
jgi:hypothetical protein